MNLTRSLLPHLCHHQSHKSLTGRHLYLASRRSKLLVPVCVSLCLYVLSLLVHNLDLLVEMAESEVI